MKSALITICINLGFVGFVAFVESPVRNVWIVLILYLSIFAFPAYGFLTDYITYAPPLTVKFWNDAIRDGLLATFVWMLLFFAIKILFNRDDLEVVLLLVLNTGYGLRLITLSAHSLGVLIGEWYFWLRNSRT